MIELGVEQRLGSTAFALILVRKIAIPVLLIIVAVILFAVHGSIMSDLAKALSVGAEPNPQTLARVSLGISYGAGIILTAGLVILLVGFVVCRLQYSNYVFSFGEFDLRMRKGIIDKKEISIPYRQIQDVNIERDPTHQMLGLSKVVLITAGNEETGEKQMNQIILEPINKEVAEEIRSLLERKIGVQIVEDTVKADREQIPNNLPQTS